MGPQEDYIETVFTCEGDYHDPHLKDRLEDFQSSLKDLLLTDKSKVILKKVEPWNSVRVTFKIPREAAVRLKQLAKQGNTTLKQLGVLAVQIQDQNISLTIAGKNNEHTQFVFRTAESAQATTSSVSVIRTNSPALQGLDPHGPGPGLIDVEATSKNIAEYLRILLPGHVPEGQKAKKNNVLSLHGIDQHKPSSQSPQPSHHAIPSSSSPSIHSLSPSQSPEGQQQVGMKFPPVPNMPPGLLAGLPPGPHDNLPPPPPYPGEGSSSAVLNSILKLPFGTPATPLLVNLLKNDPNWSSRINSGKLPANWDLDSLPGAKKKRKPRKPREKKRKEVDQTATGMPGGLPPGAPQPDLLANRHTSTTVPSAAHIVNRSFNPSLKEHGFHSVSQGLLHNTSVQSNSEQSVPLTSAATQFRQLDDRDTAGKIINPVTGLLEPMELSDTSPAKSDGDKHSPRSLAQRKALLGEDKFDKLGDRPGVMSGPQGKNSNPHLIQRPYSDHAADYHHSVQYAANIHKPYTSSQLDHNDTGGLSQQFHIQESLKNNILLKIPSLDKLEQIIPRNTGNRGTETETKCDKSSAVSVQTKKTKLHKKLQIAQEVDPKPIPPQLLNKPLLQVKHNSVSGKPSVSMDSNGDSECSSQVVSLDTHCPDPASQAASKGEPPSYNTDSGVGSCSERSDDTPSELGDNDFKPGHTNSFECAKTMGMDHTLKQAPPPNSKIMTVGYAMDETTRKDLNNHKLVSTLHGTDNMVDSALNLKTKTVTDKVDMCSTSQAQSLNWATDDQRLIANNIDVIMKRAAHESMNRKSPKLSSSGHNSVMDSMQGNSDMTMQKKKTSPRNSPRNPSSPRNPGSPRSGGSPRGSTASPRAMDLHHSPGHASGRQSFLTNPELLSAAHMSARESHSKSFREGGRSPLLEQCKSPFNMMHLPNSVPAPSSSITELLAGSGHHNSADPLHHGGMTTMRMPSQCNIDNIALLKSIEAYAPSHMTMNKDTSLLQRLEELKPLLQKYQNPVTPGSTVSPILNGLEHMTTSHMSRSPGPAVQTPRQSPTASNHNDSHPPVNSNPVMSNSVNLGHCVTNVLTSSSTISNNVQSSIPKVSKVNTEEQKNSSTSSATTRRSSPGSATSTSNPIHSFDSSLPPPKRLTESIQKLLNFPLDSSTSLPHSRRSPSSCASVTRTSSSHVTAQCIASPCGTAASNTATSTALSPTAGSRNSLSDISQIDIDSITPSISGVGLGPIVLPLDTSQYIYNADMTIPDYTDMPPLSSMDTQFINLPQAGAVPSGTTKLVTAVRGSISSHESGESVVSSKPLRVSQANKVTNVPATTFAMDVKTTVCNSDNKMASVSASISTEAVSSSSQTGIQTTGPSVLQTTGPPVLQPQAAATVRYPVHSVSVKPNGPYPQMGLSEMLQETANINMRMAAADRLPTSTVQSVSIPHTAAKPSVITSQALKTSLFTTLQTSTSSVFTPQTSKVSNFTPQVTKASVTVKSDINPQLVTTEHGVTIKINTPVNQFDKSVDKLKTMDSPANETKQKVGHAIISSKPAVLKSSSVTDTVTDDKNINDSYSDIPRLKRQTNLSLHRDRANSSPLSAPLIGSDSCDSSDMGKSHDSCSSSSSTPPVLIAVSDMQDIKPNNSEQDAVDGTSKEQVAVDNNQLSAKLKTNLAATQSQPQSTVEIFKSSSVNSLVDNSMASNLVAQKSTMELSERKVNSIVDEVDYMSQVVNNVRNIKSLRKRRASSGSAEDKNDVHGSSPRQLRSRKRPNASEIKANNVEDAKRPKLEIHGSETENKVESKSVADNTEVLISSEEPNSQTESIKSGLRTRTNTKLAAHSDPPDQTKVASGRESRKDGKVAAGKTLAEKKIEPVKPEDGKRAPTSRRNRQSPSVQTPEKLVTAPVIREKSPMRGSRTRGRNSPVTSAPDNTADETQDNKRTTRSARSKESKVEPSGKTSMAASSKRRRTSQDHR